MESLCKWAGRSGLSGMHAARAAMDQGWPFAACPWSNDGAKEVWRRSRQTRMSGVLSLWLLSLCTNKEKVTRREGEKQSTRVNKSFVGSDGGQAKRCQPYEYPSNLLNRYHMGRESHQTNQRLLDPAESL